MAKLLEVFSLLLLQTTVFAGILLFIVLWCSCYMKGTVMCKNESTERTAQNVTFHNLDVYSQDTVRYNTSNTPYPTCSMTPDVTLWQQLEHYFSLRMRLNISQKEAQMKMAEQISTMKVVVNVVRKPTFSNRSSPWDYLVLSWTEMLYNRSAVPGGSHYRVSVHGKTEDFVCPVQSYFNGTYTTCCHLSSRHCSTIKITLYYTSYAAFWVQVPYPTIRNIDVSTICPPLEQQQMAGVVPNRVCRAEELLDGSPLGRWIAPPGGNKLTWSHGYCYVAENRDKGHLKDCLQKNKVTVFGDSHQIYSTLAIKKLLGVLGPQDEAMYGNVDQEITNTTNYKFIYIQYISDILRKLDDFILKIKQDNSGASLHQDIIIISVGSWSHTFSTLEDYKHEAPKLLEKMAEIKSDPILSKVRLIFWTPPSVPDAPKFTVRMRNQFGVGAMVGYLRQELEMIGIEFLDQYNPTNVFHNMNLCQAHYLCARPTFGIENVEGEIGWATLDAFITLVCDAA